MRENKDLQAFDSDILQCKADILKALGRPADKAPAAPVMPAAKTPPHEPDENAAEADFLGAELAALEPASDTQAPSETRLPDAHNLAAPSFQPLPQSGPEPVSDPDALMKTEPEPVSPNVTADEPTPEELTITDDLLDLSNVDSEEVHAENGILKVTLQQLQRHHDDQRSQKEKALEQIRTLGEVIAPLRAANEELKRQLSESVSQMQDVARENNQIQQGLLRSLEEEKSLHRSTQAALAKLQNELQKVQKARDFLSESFSVVTEQNQQLQSQLEQLANRQTGLLVEQKQDLEQKLFDAQTNTLRLNEQLAEAAARNQELLAHQADLHEQHNTLNIQLKEAQESIADLRRQKQQQEDLAAQMARLQSIENEFQSVLAHNHSLRDELSETETVLSQAQVRIRDLDSQMRRLTDQKESADLKLEELTDVEQRHQSNETAQRHELETLKTTYLNYRRQAEDEAAELSQRVDSLSGGVQKLQQELEEYKSRAEQLGARLSEAAQTEQALRQELSCGINKQEALTAAVAELEKKVISQESAHTDALHRLQADCAELQQERTRLTLENARLLKEVERLELELRLHQETRPAALPMHPADRQLEIILEPEELSALMAAPEPQDETLAVESQTGVEQTAAQANVKQPPENNVGKSGFNLADLIMSEHRRNISVRRQRIAASSHEPADRGIRHVMEHYVKPAVGAPVPQKQAAVQTGSERMWHDDFLTPFQRDILTEIIRKDIEYLGQKNRLSSRT